MSETSKGERRHLTVLFSDLVGSTALSQRLDPEDLRDVLQAYQSLCATVIRRHEGYVAQYLGDGVLVYFGYPRAHEDDTRRAVRAAMEIVESARTVRAAGEPLQVRVGIHSGLSVVGELGEGARREELAIGETPNFAYYAQARAEPGWVVLSEATERLVRGFFRTDEIAQATNLKRGSRPMRLFRILGVTGANTRIEAASTTGLTPFVDRQAEVQFLSNAWAGVRAGTGSAILVRGEPGIGKSRLIDVVKRWIAPERDDLLECRCSPYHQNSALHPVIEMLERRFGYMLDQPLEEKRRNLEERVIALGVPPAEAVPLLAPLFSIPVGNNYPPLTMAAPTQRQRTLELLTECLMRLAARRPTLLVLEDLHWTDPTTMELVKVVLKRQRESPARLMVLLTARTEFKGVDLTCTAEMNLQPLPRQASTTLVSHLTGNKALPEDVLSQLLARAGGVPLFVEELTKAVLEGGAFREMDDRYELLGVPASVVPASILDSLMARIDRLGEGKSLAQLAATLGREFHYEVLKAVASLDDAILARDLSRLVDTELVYCMGTPPQAVYTFKHALIQDAAYDSLLRKTRQEYHERIARTLAERFSHLEDSEPELLARHYEGAGLIAEAISHWQKAGVRAMARAANLEAIAHLEHTLELVNHQPETPDRLQHELAVQLALGPALMAIKGYSAPEVRESYTRAREICRALGDVPQVYPVLWGLFAYYFVGGDLAQALDLGEQVYGLAKASNDSSLLTTASHALCYPMLYRADYRRALDFAQAALDQFDIESERAIVREFQLSSATALYDIAGTALWVLGFPDRALELAKRATALAAELKHPPSIAYAACAFSWGVPHLRREGAKVREAAETVLRLSSAEEFSFWPPLTRFFLGWSYIADGRVEAGIAETQSAMKQYRAIGGGILRTTGFAILADGHRRLGRFEEALAIIEEGLANVATSHEHHYEQELYRIKGDVLLGLGRLDQAEGAMQHALDLTRAQGAKSLELRAAMSLARLWRENGKRSAAHGLLGEIFSQFTEGFDTLDLQEAKSMLLDLGAA